MHVHGVFPYLYVPVDGPIPSERYLQQFAASVDKALNIALNRSSSQAQHVYKIALVAGM
jgi:DNA polymerase zeta